MSIDISSTPAAAQRSLPGDGASAPSPSNLAAALMTLLIQSRGAESDAARQNIDHANDLLEQARRHVQEAMARAAAADDSGGFWDQVSQVFNGDITAIAEVVATAALMAACGPGAPAILALVAAGLTLGADMGERLGLDPTLCAGLAVTGAVAGLVTGNVASTTGLWADVAMGARAAQAAAAGVGGGAHVAAGEHHADAVDARADATSARGTENDAEFRFNVALKALASAARDLERGATAASNIVRGDGDSRTALIARLGAA